MKKFVVWYEFWFECKLEKGKLTIKSIVGLPLYLIANKLSIEIDSLIEGIQSKLFEEIEDDIEENIIKIWQQIEY